MSKNVYYLDAYSMNSNSGNCMKLYAKVGEDNYKLVMIAPYLDVIPISGSNTWETASKSFSDLFSEAWREANEKAMKAVQNAMISASDTTGVDTEIGENLKQASSRVMKNPAEGIKIFADTKIAIPNRISNTFYSGLGSDFQWFQGFLKHNNSTVDAEGKVTSSEWKWPDTGEVGAFNITDKCKTPLKEMAKSLVVLCLGTLNGFDELDHGNSWQDKMAKFFKNLKLGTPNNYYVDSKIWSTNGLPGSFMLKVGNDIAIEGLLISSITITPSKLLTIDNDYYYMTVDITLEEGRMYFANELVQWIDSKNGVYNKTMPV